MWHASNCESNCKKLMTGKQRIVKFDPFQRRGLGEQSLKKKEKKILLSNKGLPTNDKSSV